MRSMTVTDTRLILDELWRLYPEADCTLYYKDEPWKLLISGILAAQCTDARVNMITPALFARYPTIAAMADARLPELEDIIRSCGFFRVKASAIKRSMEMLISDYDGKVPADFDSLLTLPGIGRKIANLIMGDSFGVPGIVVDTHCSRVSKRLGFTDSTDPYRIEKDLAAIIPRDKWTGYGHRVVAHGRAVCSARNPGCHICTLKDTCRKGREAIGVVK